MAENRGRCCKWALTMLSVIFKAVGAALDSFGIWLESNTKHTKENGLFNLIAGILIFQGTTMVALGGAGIYFSLKKEGFKVKKICVPLLILALADIVIGVFFYFKAAELKEELLKLYKDLPPSGSYETNEKKAKRILFGLYLMNLLPISFLVGLIEGHWDNHILKVCEEAGKQACTDSITSCFNLLGFGGMGIFLATAALLFITVLCIAAVVKRTVQNNRDYSLAMS